MISFLLIFYRGLKRSKTYYLINNPPQASNQEKTTEAIAYNLVLGENLTTITKQIRLIIQANLPIIGEEVNRQEIKAEIEQLGELYKIEILDSIPEGETITRYYIGSPDSSRLPDIAKNLKATFPEPYLTKPVKIPATVS